MELTTKDIIKILPFEEAFKRALIDQFDNLNPDKRYQTERLLWDLYDAIYTLKLQGKIEMALLPDGPDPRPLNKDFYKSIRQEVDKEMASEATQKTEQVDLEAAREKLQEMLKQGK